MKFQAHITIRDQFNRRLLCKFPATEVEFVPFDLADVDKVARVVPLSVERVLLINDEKWPRGFDLQVEVTGGAVYGPS